MNNENQGPKEAQTPEERNRRMMRIAGIVVILVIIIALISNTQMRKRTADTAATPTVSDCKPGDLFSQETGKPCPPADKLTATADKTPVVSAPSGYEEAIRMYAGKAVIFDASCKPMPATPSFAVGTRILVANNSNKTLTLAVGDKSEELDGYHYFTVALKAAGDAVVTCNGAPAATISVK